MTKAWLWFVDYLRGFYPFLLCLFGVAIIATIGEEHRLLSFFIGGFSIVWALDLVRARAEANAISETAAKFTEILTRGGDTDITVTFNDNRN